MGLREERTMGQGAIVKLEYDLEHRGTRDECKDLLVRKIGLVGLIDHLALRVQGFHFIRATWGDHDVAGRPGACCRGRKGKSATYAAY